MGFLFLSWYNVTDGKRLEKRQETRRMSDRKKEGGRSGMVLELNPEQKQRVNLSLHAQEILEADREQFAPQLTKNGFFNELLYRFAPQAGASISQTLERRRQTILLQLENLGMQKKRQHGCSFRRIGEAGHGDGGNVPAV